MAAEPRFSTIHIRAVHLARNALCRRAEPDACRSPPLVGLDAPTLELALNRASYGVQPIDAATLDYQQQIADTFTELKLIPKKLVVADAKWRAV